MLLLLIAEDANAGTCDERFTPRAAAAVDRRKRSSLVTDERCTYLRCVFDVGRRRKMSVDDL